MRIIDKQTASVDARWTEPTTNSDGTPLTDLAYSSVYYSVNNGPKIVGAKVSATKPQGGGTLTTTIIVPAPEGVITVLSMSASATDLAGNESAPTAPAQITIERVAPAVPTGFTIA